MVTPACYLFKLCIYLYDCYILQSREDVTENLEDFMMLISNGMIFSAVSHFSGLLLKLFLLWIS